MKIRTRSRSIRLMASILIAGSGTAIAVAGLSQNAFAQSIACASASACQINGGSTGVINTYYSGSTVTTTNSTSTITMKLDPSHLNASTPVSPGDTILILQNQGGTYSTSSSSSYGTLSNLAAGTYEFATVATVSVAGNVTTVTTTTPLTDTFSASAQQSSSGSASASSISDFQVVRVPTYIGDAELTSNLTALPWNGSDGGIFALSVTGQLNLNGYAINVSGDGFRGGIGYALSGGVEPVPALGSSDTGYAYPGSDKANGQKGEGVVGTPNQSAIPSNSYVDGYATGDFGRGAPGNAGGGGTDPDGHSNDENTGGGGGGNGGSGGQGGFSWDTGLNDGGLGGSSLTPSSHDLFLGGGGGAGTVNNSEPKFAGSGGNGGGIIVLTVGGLTGTGSLSANGSNGVASPYNDGGGGGGAGGTIYVQTDGTCSPLSSGAVTVSAIGGNGGTTWANESLLPAAASSSARDLSNLNGNAHGPGGGGGGGVLLTNVLTGLQSMLAGGSAGTTTNGSLNGQTLPSGTSYQNQNYGATAGSTGLLSSIGPNGDESGSCAPPPTTQPSTPVTQPSTPVTQPSTPVTQPSTAVTQPSTPVTQPSTPVTTAPAVHLASSQSSSVTVPLTHTGEPWAGTTWWYLVAGLAFTGSVLVFPKRKQSAHTSEQR
ncbi:MAG: hypothetical protein ACP5O0_04960 [Acidimicrobiales bacterium]